MRLVGRPRARRRRERQGSDHAVVSSGWAHRTHDVCDTLIAVCESGSERDPRTVRAADRLAAPMQHSGPVSSSKRAALARGHNTLTPSNANGQRAFCFGAAQPVVAVSAKCRALEHLPRRCVGVCDAPETCRGSSDVCPSDARRSTATSIATARASRGAVEAVISAGAVCARCVARLLRAVRSRRGVSPSAVFVADGTLCRAAVGACDRAEFCTGRRRAGRSMPLRRPASCVAPPCLTAATCSSFATTVRQRRARATACARPARCVALRATRATRPRCATARAVRVRPTASRRRAQCAALPSICATRPSRVRVRVRG